MSNGRLLINKPKSLQQAVSEFKFFAAPPLQWKFIKSFWDFTRAEKARAMVAKVLRGSYFQKEGEGGDIRES